MVDSGHTKQCFCDFSQLTHPIRRSMPPFSALSGLAGSVAAATRMRVSRSFGSSLMLETTGSLMAAESWAAAGAMVRVQVKRHSGSEAARGGGRPAGDDQRRCTAQTPAHSFPGQPACLQPCEPAGAPGGAVAASGLSYRAQAVRNASNSFVVCSCACSALRLTSEQRPCGALLLRAAFALGRSSRRADLTSTWTPSSAVPG